MDAAERARLVRHARTLGIERPLDGDALRLNAGRCVFLDTAGCRLHAAFGPEAKPTACRQFPKVLVRGPDGVRVGIDPGCYTWPETQDATALPATPALESWATPLDLDVPTWAALAKERRLDRADLVRAWRRLPLVPWLESLHTAPRIRETLLPVARAAGSWSVDAPPAWPEDPVALEGLRRMAALGLVRLDQQVLADLGLLGGVGIGWAAPGDPAPLAAWWRIVRVPSFVRAAVVALRPGCA